MKAPEPVIVPSAIPCQEPFMTNCKVNNDESCVLAWNMVG
jgi:hypothetical protein